jgi:spermidine synthase
MRISFQRTAVGLSFFLSGTAALVYQVCWQRILALQSGVGIYSIALIVAAFMVGLGVGSEMGGRLSLRVGNRGALLAFVGLEIGIALFGAGSASLYYDILYLQAPWLYSSPWRAGASHLLGLIVPTALMGMSLPFLARGTVRDAATAGRTVGFLYGLNLVGASVGALLGPWLLVRIYGIRGALLAAALANVVAAVTALCARSLEPREPAEPPPVDMSTAPPLPKAPASGRETPFALWMTLYCLSGFCALSLEMLWFRMIDVAVKSTAFTFGTVLSVYLLGSAVGTLAGVALVHRVVRPLRVFLIAQCVILGWAAGWAALYAGLPKEGVLFQRVFDLHAAQQTYDSAALWTVEGVVKAYLVLPLVLYGVPTLLMGFSFTVLQRAVHDDVRTSGRKVGLLQAANIVGCVAGSLLVGLLALTFWGTTGTLRALTLLGVGFALLGWRMESSKRLFGAAALVLGLLAAAVPSQEELWARFHGVLDRPLMVDEDASGVIGISTVDAGERWRVWVNGRRHSAMPFGGVHTLLGAAPAIVHPSPRDVAVIGLGSGDTAWAAGCRGQETVRVTVFEICAPERRLLTRLAATAAPPPRLREFLADPRVVHRLADGRNALHRGSERYDVIEMDALHPSSPYSGNLYSEEFLRICASRLNPNGLLCTWAPTSRVFATVQKVFPYVLNLGEGLVLLGSLQPIEMQPEVWRARLARPDVLSYLGARQARTLGEALTEGRLARARRWRKSDYNYDLFPRDEFNSPEAADH